MPADEARRIQEEYSASNAGKSIPDSEFRMHRQSPLLLLYLTSPHAEGTLLDTGGKPLVALGLSFPSFDDSSVARRVRYDINLVAFHNMYDMEADDELEAEDDDF
jgi:hypothetical protein